MKRYAIPTKTKALNLINSLELKDKETASKDIHGIMVWGFEYKKTHILDDKGQLTFDDNGFVLIKTTKGTTYNVDVVWKSEQNTEWEQYEVNPISPSHTVS